LKLARRIAAALAAAIFILMALQFTLPQALERRVERELARTFEGSRMVRVGIEAFPAVALLWGRVDRIHLDLRRVPLGDLVVDAVLVDGKDLVVDVPKLLWGNGVEIQGARELRATFVIAEEDLNQYFWSQIHDARFFKVSLTRGQAVLEGGLTLFGREIDVRVSGVFRVAGPASIAFIPQQVTVDNAAVPQLLVDWVTSEWQIVLDLGEAPFAIAIEELWVEEGELLIYGARPASG